MRSVQKVLAISLILCYNKYNMFDEARFGYLSEIIVYETMIRMLSAAYFWKVSAYEKVYIERISNKSHLCRNCYCSVCLDEKKNKQ